ncbi:MAG TPA: hypothetical protein VI756_14670 [Blastocatellia bacterium]
MAAAKGMLPLSNEEMLQALVALGSDPDDEVRGLVGATMKTLDAASYAALAADENATPEVLGFLLIWDLSPKEVLEAAVFNQNAPDEALAEVARRTRHAHIIEAISLKQQSLIKSPAIIDGILANPARTPEAERRAREVQQEFFEKQFGAKQVAREQQVQDVARSGEVPGTVKIGSIHDLISLGLIEEGIDDTLVDEYESQYGPFDSLVGPILQPEDIERMTTGDEADGISLPPERLPVFQQIAIMSIKARVMLAIKGTREARMILVRDPNRIVASAVLRNPRLTDTEVEAIAAMKTAPDDVLRQIGQNRAWIRSYTVIHNLVRNPRVPIATSLGLLNRIQTRDLRVLGANKNVPDVIRTTAARMYIKRSSGVGG